MKRLPILVAIIAFLCALAMTMQKLVRPEVDMRFHNRLMRRNFWREATRGLTESMRFAYWRFVCRLYGIRPMAGGSSAVKTFGATLTWNGTAIAEVINFGMPGIKTTMIDVSNEDSANAFKEYIAGMHDGGQLALECNLLVSDTNGQIAMEVDALAGTARSVVITFSGGTSTWTATCLCSDWQPSGVLDGQLKVAMTLKVTGKPVLAITASANATTIAYEDSVGVKTSLPVFAGGTYLYTVTINTASTYIKVTVTDATAATIVATALGINWNLTTGVQSGEIVVGAAATTTLLTVAVTDTGKVAKTYQIYVVRP